MTSTNLVDLFYEHLLERPKNNKSEGKTKTEWKLIPNKHTEIILKLNSYFWNIKTLQTSMTLTKLKIN